MHAVGMTQAQRTHLAIEQRVVHRVENTIAHACNDGEKDQHPVARASRETASRQPQQRETAKQYWSRAESIHHKARASLHGAGGNEEHRDQETKFGVTRIERVLEPGKEGRQ